MCADSHPEASRSRKDSSKRTSRERPASQAVDFEFLNFSHPSDAKASRARRTVRSHVTRQQHHKEHLAAARRSQSVPQVEVSSTSSQQTGLPRLETRSSYPSQSFERSAHFISQSDRSPSTVSTSASPHQQSPVAPLSRIDLLEVFPREWNSSIHTVLEHCK